MTIEEKDEAPVVPAEEIDDMLGLQPLPDDDASGDGDGEPAPAGEASTTAPQDGTKASAEAPAANEPPATEVPPQDDTITSPAAPQTPPAQEELTELQIAQRHNEALRLQLNELAKMGLTIPLPTAQTSPTEGTPVPTQPIVPTIPVTPPAAPATPQPMGTLQDIIAKLNGEQNFLSPDELDSVVDKPELINVAINKAMKHTSEQFLQAIPLIAAGIATQQITLNNMALDFYEKNSDLAPYKEFVSAIAKQVEASNKDKNYEELFELTATQVRERLGLKVTTPQTDKTPSGVKPAFAGTRGPARQAAPVKQKQDDMATQIADLLS